MNGDAADKLHVAARARSCEIDPRALATRAARGVRGVRGRWQRARQRPRGALQGRAHRSVSSSKRHLLRTQRAPHWSALAGARPRPRADGRARAGGTAGQRRWARWRRGGVRTAPRQQGSAAACAQRSSTGWVVSGGPGKVLGPMQATARGARQAGAHSAAVDAQRQAGRRGGAQRHAHGGAQRSAAQQHAAQPAGPGSASDLATKSHERLQDAPVTIGLFSPVGFLTLGA